MPRIAGVSAFTTEELIFFKPRLRTVAFFVGFLADYTLYQSNLNVLSHT